MTPKNTRPESERAAADRLTEALGCNVHRSTVRRLKARGINLADLAAVRHALNQQERQPGPTNQNQPDPKPPAPESGPLTSNQLDARLQQLEADLLAAPDYHAARTIKMQISGFKELVRTQKERGFLIDRSFVQAGGYQIGNIIRTHLMQLPAKLVTQLLGLEYGEAVERAEDYAHEVLTEMHQAALAYAVPIPSDLLKEEHVLE
jgi:hypothetical protein